MMSWRLACEQQTSYSREVDAQVAQRKVLYDIMAAVRGRAWGEVWSGARYQDHELALGMRLE